MRERWYERIGDWFGLLSSNTNEISAWSQAGAAVLSALALVLTLWVFVRQQRLNRWQLRLHREDAIIVWSRSVLGVLAEIEERAMAPDQRGHGLTIERRLECRAHLSALIDEGRLFFPNVQDPKKGAQNDPAYQGHRQPILTALVHVYDWLKPDWEERDRGWNSEQAKVQLDKQRRKFVSHAQAAIDPRTFNQVRA